MAGISKRDRIVVELGKRLGRIDEAAAGNALAQVQVSGIAALDALVEAGALDDVGAKAVLAEVAKLVIRCAACGRDDLLMPGEPIPNPKRCETCRGKKSAPSGVTKALGPAAGRSPPPPLKTSGRFSVGPPKPGAPPASPAPALQPAPVARAPGSSTQKLKPFSASGPNAAPAAGSGPSTRRLPGPGSVGPGPGAPPSRPAPPPPPPADDEEEESTFRSYTSDPRIEARTSEPDPDEPAFKSHHTDPRAATPAASAAPGSADPGSADEDEPRFRSSHSDPRNTPATASADGEEPTFKSHHTDPRATPGAAAAPAGPEIKAEDLRFSDVMGGPSSSATDLVINSPQRTARQKLEELKGATIGDCVLEQIVGRGAMGSVFAAQNQKLGKRVAIKLLEPKLANDPKFVNRFFQEAQALALLDNPHVVRVYAFDKDESGRCYIVMELLDGGSVQSLLKKKGKLEIDEAVRIVSEAAKGLHAAHKVDLVHRDVKPANLMMNKDGRVKVVDFGLAVPTSGEVFLATEVVGTPVYMSPEQADGVRLDGRCDQYALGVTLYQLVCGRPPFNQRKPVDVIAAHMRTPPPPPHELREDIPAWLEDVILRMLAKAPDERFPSLAEVYQALDSRGAGMEPPKLDRLARPAVTVDANTIADLDAKGVHASVVEMPGWTVPIAVALLAVAATVIFLVGSGSAGADDHTSGPPHVVERRLAELKPRIERGSPEEVAAALASLDADLDAMGKAPGAASVTELRARADHRLEELRGKREAEIRDRVRALLGKGHHAAAIDAAVADPAQIKTLNLEAFLADLRGEAVGRLENDKGEDYVPPGLFRAGPEGEPSTTGGFYLERTEVTNDAYARALDAAKLTPPASWKGPTPPAGTGLRPVTGITYEEAERYAKSLGKRLPTALEWEKAARGHDDARAYPWGPVFVAGRANLIEGGSGALEDVQARAGDVSPFGILGLAGNALEWVVGPEGPLVAGGGYGSDALAGRVFTRVAADPKLRDPAVGFRCARDIEPGN